MMSRMPRWVLAGTIAALFAASGSLPGLSATQSPAAERSMTMALTGDSLITMKLSVHTEPPFVKMIDLIRGADVAFTNLEMLFHDYEPYPMTQSGGTYMRADPSIAKELVWAGFDLVARANNHTGDYGAEGMRLTTKYVAEAGLVQAGVGESLREAREARYLDTGKGRVALISVASTFPDFSRAGTSWGDTRARPGLNPLRFTTTNVVTRQQFDALRSALSAAGIGGRGAQPPANANPNEMRVFDRRIVVGDKQETRTEPLKEDLDGIAAVVRNASRQADYTIINSHTHEGGADRYAPPEFFVSFSRAMIDAGADVITASGPHVLRGIEIYKGKPIFYGLGDFIFQNETLLRQPPENYEPLGLKPESGAGVGDFNDRRSNNDTTGFPADPYIWESVVAVPRFVGKRLTELKLYPISLGYKKPRPQRGWPMLADPELSRKIIDDLKKFSAPFGTNIEFRDGVGIVAVGS
jgi:poly-gamma-glutamate capsule biosynthesis protein CapA/YwtB (metallophosphatase superfamily)